MKSKIENIQLLRALAVMLVVIYHLFRAEEKYFPETRLLPDATVFGAGGVDLFFVISGFVMMWTTALAKTSVADFLLRRALRIYPMYWLVTAVVYAVYLLRPSWVNSSQGGEFSLVHSLLLLPHQRLPLLMVGWSLIFEVYFYLVFSCLLLLRERVRIRALMAWLLLLPLSGFLRTSILEPYHPELANDASIRLLTSPMAAEFILGCLAAYLLRTGVSSRFGLPFLFFGLSTYLLSPLFSTPDVALGLEWGRVFSFGLPFFFLVLGAALLEPRGNGVRLRMKMFHEMGDASYSIYLLHLLVISAGARLLSATGYGVLLGEGRLLLLFLATLIVGNLSYRFVESPLNRLTRSLLSPLPGRKDSEQVSRVRALSSVPE